MQGLRPWRALSDLGPLAAHPHHLASERVPTKGLIGMHAEEKAKNGKAFFAECASA